jgi:hypothetical protein
MKYLKLYRSFNEGIFDFFKKKEKFTELLYRTTDYNEFLSFIKTHKSENPTFSKKEIDILKINRCRNFYYKVSDDGHAIGMRFFHKYKYCSVCKFQDEWYTLKTISERSQFRPQGIEKYFICDTLEGLIQALKENK